VFLLTKNIEKYLPIILITVYLFLLINKLDSLPLFVGDEAVYTSSVEGLISGFVDNNNHPLLAKEIWAFFVYLVRGYFGIESVFFWRVGTVIFSIVSLVVFFKILRLFFTKKISYLGTLILALDPMYFAFSRIVMLDIISLSLGLSSLYFLLKFLKSKTKKDLINGGIFIGLSLAAKMAALSLVLLLPIYLGLILKKSKKFLPAILYFLASIILGFCLGNFIYFLLPHKIAFISYVSEIFSSQLNLPEESSLTSTPLSWFTIPQVLTLFRIVYKDGVRAVLAFQNPLIFLFTIPAIFVTSLLLIKRKVKLASETLLILLFFLAQFFPWFLGLHPTYYFYVIPLTPLSIILILKLINLLALRRFLYPLLIVFSLAVFIFYYPLLTGIKIPKKYEKILFSYSQYNFPPKNAIFCQKCSPR